ncbi:TPA: DUF4158 domain-containing protein [Yersinia enterocolitica]|uniref:DUF4158 domain-containing protein n=2 Tax=Yersinia enterocolitica TaxID=630 RepID=A0A7T9XTK5_YEREN|nr:transposase for transposon gamma-delta [Yersinia enterocolitica subsp. palearctica PhRBD_Ye1]EKN3314859.1 DUF4158 domain-containing protein [Yersinia enterocolitica]EOR68928.1 putative site-specific recombinase [Yersinia enterocolitica subsp. palearctica YE-149]EOR79441.1 putative site-specific recombinase [Yersinia enterocolitica subsp. palearctica YE-P1]EOR79502.1 putative site-specific recombinase [Yersinia enterocolitica subsp. palearctica YE-150]EOR83050.1 putative site-specific recomb
MNIKIARIYERVSTSEQDLTRQADIEKTAIASGFYIAGIYRENDFDRLNISEKRGEHNRLGYAVLLCTVRYLGRFPDLTAIIPVAVID